MKDLKQWLTWATTETHVDADERADRIEDLDEPEQDAAVDAAHFIALHALPEAEYESKNEDGEVPAWVLTHHPEAFRDLCLSFAEAVERMRDVVPEAVAEPESNRSVVCCSHPPGYFCFRCAPTPECGEVDDLAGKGVLELGPGAVPSREYADRFRGITGYDWKIMGERDHWYPWDTLRYLVEHVLAPGGGRITAEDERLHGLTWWPRRPG